VACHPVIERYIAEVSVRLPGPRHWRAEVLDEIRDSLLEGMDAHSDGTGDLMAAAQRAVAEHGPVDQISGAYAPEAAVVWARRAGLLTLGIIPVMAVVWNVALSVGPSSQWRPAGLGLHLAAALIAGGVCLTSISSGAALIGTGRLSRIVSGHLQALRLAICAASAASAAVSVAVLTLLGVVAARAVTAPESLEWPAVLAALALSLTALTSVGHIARRCVTSFDAALKTSPPPTWP
jgi:hypothetical protein